MGYKSTGIVLAEKPSIGIEPTRLYDASRFKNHGVHTNITMVQLPSGLWVRSFNGSSSYIIIPHNGSFNFGALTDFAIFMWLKTSHADRQELIAKGNTGAKWFALYINSNKVSAFIDDGTNSREIIGATNPVDGEGHLVGVVFDRDGNGQIYIDGQPDGAAVDISGVGDISTTNDIYIGKNETAAGRDMEGDIGFFKTTNYAPSPEQIAAKFQKERHWFGV